MGSYMEEVFKRAEEQFITRDSILAWLDSFERPERGETAYTKDALSVREDLRFQVLIEEETDLDELDKLKKEATKLTIQKEEAIDLAETRLKDLTLERIEEVNTIEEVEEIKTRGIKGVKKVKESKLKHLESIERTKVRIRLIDEVMDTRGVSESDAERIVIREKLVTQELGAPTYL